MKAANFIRLNNCKNGWMGRGNSFNAFNNKLKANNINLMLKNKENLQS